MNRLLRKRILSLEAAFLLYLAFGCLKSIHLESKLLRFNCLDPKRSYFSFLLTDRL